MRAVLFVLLAAACLALAVLPRGVAPGDKALYSDKQFTCRDGSQKLPLSRVNDDFCDCLDGSDEPGTSACLNGVFWCKNKGFRGTSIPSWKVNDRICDCCDGSDEYDGARCPNTCAEMDREAKKSIYAELDRLKSGLAKKKQYIAAGEEALRQAAASIADLKMEVEHKREEVKLKEDLKRQADDRERLARDARKIKEDEERAAYDAAHPAPAPAPAAEVPVEVPADAGTDGSHYDDDGPDYDVLHDDEEHFDEPHTPPAPAPEVPAPELQTPPEPEAQAPASPQAPPFEPSDELKELQAEATKFEDGDTPLPPPHVREQLDRQFWEARRGRETLWERVRGALLEPIEDLLASVSSLFGSLFFDSPDESAAEAEARRVREAYTEASSKLRELESKLASTEKLLTVDLGPQKEFYPLWDHTFSTHIEQYKYDVKPFNEVNQGHTNMGKWGSWSVPYTKMSYTNGVSCWQGPARSCEVTLLCGDKEEILEVKEPNKCEYAMKFTTPAACNEHDLERLQKQLKNDDADDAADDE